MKKTMVISLLFFLPLLLLVQLVSLNSTTGDVVNDLATVRLERLNLARSPFYGRIDAECRAYVRTIDQHLRLGADERYYSPNGLVQNPAYFVNERTLFERLDGMQHENTPCSADLKVQAGLVAQQIANINIHLGNVTMQRKDCTADAQWYFDQAVFLARNDRIAAMNYLEHALALC